MFRFLCIVKQKKNSERSENFWKSSFLKIYFKKNVWKVGFQFMLILGLLGMYFDAAVVFVRKSSLFLRLAVAILCLHLFSALEFLNGLRFSHLSATRKWQRNRFLNFYRHWLQFSLFEIVTEQRSLKWAQIDREKSDFPSE